MDSTTRVREGDRVRLVATTDPWTKLKPGDVGTVEDVDDIGTIHVRWDTGSCLGMVPGQDRIAHVSDPTTEAVSR